VPEDAAGRQHLLWTALDHLQFALDLLDRACAPAQIGARVDGAIHELETEIASNGELDVGRAKQAKPN
jgi:hypothetical protein